MADPTRADDMRLLKMLDLHEDGLTYLQISERFSMSRSGISGAISRVKREMRSDNGVGNGTMPRGWWA